jgi:hypothetical protein
MFCYTTVSRPQDDVYRVEARFEGRTVTEYYATPQAALEARDRLFDQGAHSVHVSNLPTTGCCAGFPVRTTPLPEVRDE